MNTNIQPLLNIMKALREPKTGCPWDLEQDFKSIIPHTLEEVYEVIDAIERDDKAHLCDELGDLLFQVVYYAHLASEEGSFRFEDVLERIEDKLIRRHPHVFGDADIRTSEEQTKAWEQQKNEERQQKNDNVLSSVLDDVSPSLPSLMRARKLQKRAATVGFDWDDISPVLAKVREEIDEVEVEITENSEQDKISDEIGDLLFACVNLARHSKVDPEIALRAANQKFERRFRYIETTLAKDNRSPKDSNLAEMDALWDQAKTANL